MTLVALPRELCPDCGNELQQYQADQPALFKHGGYGATERTILALCTCGYGRQRERSEVTPRGRP